MGASTCIHCGAYLGGPCHAWCDSLDNGDSVDDRLYYALARIAELEARLDAIAPKPVDVEYEAEPRRVTIDTPATPEGSERVFGYTDEDSERVKRLVEEATSKRSK